MFLNLLMVFLFKDQVIPFPKALNEEQSKLLGSLVEPVERYFLEKGNMCSFTVLV